MVVSFTGRGELREDWVGKKIKIDREEKRLRDHTSRSNILPGICCGFKIYPQNLCYSSLQVIELNPILLECGLDLVILL